MSENLNALFETENNSNTTSSRGLNGTAQLTSIASGIAQDIYTALDNNLKQLKADGKEEELEALIASFAASRTSNDAMDKLIDEYHPLDDTDVEFLKQLDEETQDSMLKSQQSKRSRSKSKANTRENYLTTLTGAVAENLIRLASGKEKSSGGSRRVSGSIDYTPEQMENFELDQEKLKKEIRNVQSKKSIMKSKAGFDKSDERYQQLLRVETMLKDLRTGGVTETITVEVDHTKDALGELLADVDLHNIHAKDGKELLEKIASLLQPKE